MKRIETAFHADVAIIITTRNRPRDLTQTLLHLHTLGLCSVPLYIVDDASEEDIASPEALALFTDLHLRRNESCRGLIVNRNELAAWASAEVLISLDDDSCFTFKPDLDALVQMFRSDPRLCAVEFDNIDPPAVRGSDVPDGALVQMFTGFGHAIQRSRFLALGGYRESFVHMCEERDFCQRAWRDDFTVRKYRAIQVQHRRTPVARLQDRNVFYLCRNTMAFSIFNYGLMRMLWVPLAAIYMTTMWPPSRGRRLIALKAVVSGLALVARNVDEIHPMTAAKYFSYRRLPQR